MYTDVFVILLLIANILQLKKKRSKKCQKKAEFKFEIKISKISLNTDKIP